MAEQFCLDINGDWGSVDRVHPHHLPDLVLDGLVQIGDVVVRDGDFGLLGEQAHVADLAQHFCGLDLDAGIAASCEVEKFVGYDLAELGCVCNDWTVVFTQHGTNAVGNRGALQEESSLADFLGVDAWPAALWLVQHCFFVLLFSKFCEVSKYGIGLFLGLRLVVKLGT